MVPERTEERRRSERGVTLIELLIAVAIIGVLATMATVGFRHFVRKARSVEGNLALMEVRKLQDGFHSELGQYAPNFTSIGYAKLDQLSFYAVTMIVGTPGSGIAYEANADPMPGWDLRIWHLTQYDDHSWVLTQSDDPSTAVAGPAQPPDTGGGAEPPDTGGGADPEGGGDPGGLGKG